MRCLLVAALLAVMGAAHAEPNNALSAQDLVRACRQLSDKAAAPTFEQGICLGYLLGVTNTHGFFEYAADTKRPLRRLFCPPTVGEVGDTANEIVAFASSHPQEARGLAFGLILAALSANHPCPK